MATENTKHEVIYQSNVTGIFYVEKDGQLDFDNPVLNVNEDEYEQYGGNRIFTQFKLKGE